MQITLEQREIEEAIKSYIRQHGLDFGNRDPQINLVAGRGPSGITANIELSSLPQTVTIAEKELEVLPKKVEKEPELFVPEEGKGISKPALKKVAPKKKKVTPKPAQEEKLDEDLDETFEDEEELVEESGTADLFGSDDPLPEADTELDGDSLFAS